LFDPVEVVTTVARESMGDHVIAGMVFDNPHQEV
jgi:hypothetical protein